MQRSSSVIAEPRRMAEHPELGDVAAEEERHGPVGYDAELSRDQRQLVQVVRPRHEPADEASQRERRRRARFPCSVRASPPGRGFGSGTASARRERFRASRRACRSECWEVGGSGRPGVASFGTRAQSPSAQRLSWPSTRSCESTGTAPRSSTGNPRSRRIGFGETPAVQTSVWSRDALAAREDDTACADGLERRRRVDLDAAAGELLRRVLAEPGRDLRQDLRRRVDEHPARLGAAGAPGSGASRLARGRRARPGLRRPRSRRRRRRRSAAPRHGGGRAPSSPPRADGARGSGDGSRPRDP